MSYLQSVYSVSKSILGIRYNITRVPYVKKGKYRHISQVFIRFIVYLFGLYVTARNYYSVYRNGNSAKKILYVCYGK